MALKRFRVALADCQTAATIQKASPQPKTLLRLARCQIALGQQAFATSTLNTILGIESGNVQAKQLQQKVAELEAHLINFQKCKSSGDWGMARLALDKCLQAVDGEGAEVPVEWRVWRVQVELGRGNWDAAGTAAKYVLGYLLSRSTLIYIPSDAMRLHNTSPEVIALRGLVMFLTNKLPSALQHAQSALRLDPSLEAAQELRKRVKDVERLKEDGNAAFKSGKMEDALKFYGDTLDRIGERVEEGKGGQIRATLLSNRATTLVKVFIIILSHTTSHTDTVRSSTDIRKLCSIPMPPSYYFQLIIKHSGLERVYISMPNHMTPRSRTSSLLWNSLLRR